MANKYIRDLNPWPVGTPLPADAQLLLYAPELDEEFRFTPVELPDGGEAGPTNTQRGGPFYVTARDASAPGYTAQTSTLASIADELICFGARAYVGDESIAYVPIYDAAGPLSINKDGYFGPNTGIPARWELLSAPETAAPDYASFPAGYVFAENQLIRAYLPGTSAQQFASRRAPGGPAVAPSVDLLPTPGNPTGTDALWAFVGREQVPVPGYDDTAVLEALGDHEGRIRELEADIVTVENEVLAVDGRLDAVEARPVAKYYAATGQNTDGGLTQKAATDAFALKTSVPAALIAASAAEVAAGSNNTKYITPAGLSAGGIRAGAEFYVSNWNPNTNKIASTGFAIVDAENVKGSVYRITATSVPFATTVAQRYSDDTQLRLSSVAGVGYGHRVSGAGIPAGAFVTELVGSVVTLNVFTTTPLGAELTFTPQIGTLTAFTSGDWLVNLGGGVWATRPGAAGSTPGPDSITEAQLTPAVRVKLNAAGGGEDPRKDLSTDNVRGRTVNIRREGRCHISNITLAENATSAGFQLIQNNAALAPARTGTPVAVAAALNADLDALVDPSFYTIRQITVPINSANAAVVLVTVLPV